MVAHIIQSLDSEHALKLRRRDSNLGVLQVTVRGIAFAHDFAHDYHTSDSEHQDCSNGNLDHAVARSVQDVGLAQPVVDETDQDAGHSKAPTDVENKSWE